MRLLLRANSHRPGPGGELEIAASPDTRYRERWQWDVRLAPEHGVPPSGAPADRALEARAALRLADGAVMQVLARAAPAEAVPSVEIHRLTAPLELRRDLQEVVVVLAGGPGLLLEGRHLLGCLDAMVLEGEDPFTIPLEAAGAEATPVAVIRLMGTAGLGWVP